LLSLGQSKLNSRLDTSKEKQCKNANSEKPTWKFSALGLGCMGLSFGFGPPLIKRKASPSFEPPSNAASPSSDTAEVYGPYTNEELVGDALAPFRNQVAIATKFGWKIDPSTGKQAGLDSRPAHIKDVADASLKRLKTNVIDLFYHTASTPTCPSKM